jgi:ribonuclease P protein component
MLNSKYRFHSSKDLEAVFKRCRNFNSTCFNLKVQYTNDPGVHVAVVTSKKISKLAVERNLVRRRVYEILRLNLPADTSANIIVRVQSKEILVKSYSELQTELLYLLMKANLTHTLPPSS